MAGRFIVIEGLDGAGKKTQAFKLKEYLESKGKEAIVVSLPDYSRPIGQLIDRYLHNHHDFSPEALFLLFAGNILEDKPTIENVVKRGFVIADRYFTSTIAYQCTQGFDMERALKFAKTFDMPRPDIVIYLKISPETAAKRKHKQKGGLDRLEADITFLAKVSKTYATLIKRRVMGNWVVLDGEQSIDEVFKDVKRALKV